MPQQVVAGVASQAAAYDKHSIDLAALAVASDAAGPVAHYAKVPEDYCNKCDFDVYPKLLPQLPCCSHGVFLIGGMNEGQLADLVLQTCPNATVHGFEIQTSVYERLLLKYSGQSNRIVLNNRGLADGSRTMPVSGSTEGAGLRTKWTRFNESWDGKTTVETVGLAQYVESKHLQNRVCMALIDVEGYEPKVSHSDVPLLSAVRAWSWSSWLTHLFFVSRSCKEWSYLQTIMFSLCLLMR
jgi:FkbM family methyltransferase